MNRAELFQTIAAVLPIGAFALVPEESPKPALPTPPAKPEKTRWMIVHPNRDGALGSYHEYGQECGRCLNTGVPAPLWYGK